jgi:hypothetical protein
LETILIKRTPILKFCFFQNLKRVRIRQALKLRPSNTYSVWDLAFSGAVFGDNSDQADSDFDFLVLRAILENFSGRMLLEPLSAIVSAILEMPFRLPRIGSGTRKLDAPKWQKLLGKSV